MLLDFWKAFWTTFHNYAVETDRFNFVLVKNAYRYVLEDLIAIFCSMLIIDKLCLYGGWSFISFEVCSHDCQHKIEMCPETNFVVLAFMAGCVHCPQFSSLHHGLV
jgi:hypothetical protein